MNAETKKKKRAQGYAKEKSVLYEDAIRRFVASNLDLLTPAELKKYKGKVLL